MVTFFIILNIIVSIAILIYFVIQLNTNSDKTYIDSYENINRNDYIMPTYSQTWTTSESILKVKRKTKYRRKPLYLNSRKVYKCRDPKLS